MISIEDLSETENILVNSASKEYGPIYENSRSLVLLMSEFIFKISRPEAWIFIGFLTQVQNSLYLALLSTIRRHDVQSLMMLRYSLESAVLACYALFDINPDNYAVIEPDDSLKIKGRVREKANRWLEANFKEHSGKIKYFKDVINDTSAHANFGPVFSNADFSKSEEIINHIFDDNLEDKEHHELMIRQRLWWIGNISFGLLDLFYGAIIKYPLVELVDDFIGKMQELGKENERIKIELKNHSRFSKIRIINDE